MHFTLGDFRKKVDFTLGEKNDQRKMKCVASSFRIETLGNCCNWMSELNVRKHHDRTEEWRDRRMHSQKTQGICISRQDKEDARHLHFASGQKVTPCKITTGQTRPRHLHFTSGQKKTQGICISRQEQKPLSWTLWAPTQEISPQKQKPLSWTLWAPTQEISQKALEHVIYS